MPLMKPVMLAVDDDREVLGAVERDLRRRYQQDYRILKASSGEDALAAVHELKRRGAPLALLLVDQRMPGMSGTETLLQASALFPDALKVLLTAYADTQAAIDSINKVGLHHYLMKPWHPPEERLYPVLDDLLSEWTARVRLPFEGVRVAGEKWSPGAYAVREFLSRNQVPYQWIDIEQDAPMRQLVTQLSGGTLRLPVVLFPDGGHLIAPGMVELADRVGLDTRAKCPFYDVVIVGGGPAGLADAVYAASEGLRALLIERSAPGGQAGTSSRIENYLGFPSGITGEDLARRATAQAKRFGAEMITAQGVSRIRREDPYRIVTLDDGSEVSAYTVLLATGMQVRTLDVPGIAALSGAGVYYGAAMSEAASCRGHTVAIVGGGNSAGQAALYFARHARQVILVIRGASLGATMSRYLVDRIEATPAIQVASGTEVAEARGDAHLEEVVLRDAATGALRSVPVAGLFIFIGAKPNSEMVADLVARDEAGFILTGPDVKSCDRTAPGWAEPRAPLLFETSVPGIFAAGDVRSGANRRVAAAVGEGSAAIYSIHRYLETV